MLTFVSEDNQLKPQDNQDRTISLSKGLETEEIYNMFGVYAQNRNESLLTILLLTGNTSLKQVKTYSK